MHADLVRAAGLELGLEQRDRRVGARPGADPPEHRRRRLAFALDAHPPLALAGDVGLQRQVDPPLASRQLPRTSTGSACRSAPSRNAACSATSAVRFLATSSTPEVSRSSRWTSSRNFASGRACRSRSMTPKAMPLPPWTASPAGLSSAISASSSNSIGGSGPAARRPPRRPGASGAAPRRPAPRSGRDADLVADRQPGVRTDPLPVHPDLAAAQDPVDVALRHALEDADQEIVDPLPGRLVADRKPGHRILA